MTNPNDRPKVCSEVTKFLRANTDDKEIKLRRGRGYFYFLHGKADFFGEQGVYGVGRVSEFTFAGWLAEYQDRARLV